MTESDHIESGDEKVDMTQNLTKKETRQYFLLLLFYMCGLQSLMGRKLIGLSSSGG